MTRRDAATGTTNSNNKPPAAPSSPETPRRRGRSRRKRSNINSEHRRRTLQDIKEEPFLVTFIKVGTTLLLLSCGCYAVFLQRNLFPPTNGAIIREKQLDVLPPNVQQQSSLKGRNHQHRPVTTVLREAQAFRKEKAWTDAYGIASEYQLLPKNKHGTSNEATAPGPLQAFAEAADLLRFQFATLVGGEEEARAILQRSLLSIRPTKASVPRGKPATTSPQSLAHRLAQIHKSKTTTFSIAVMGSSAAAGVGNFFPQSYAFGMEHQLREVFASLNIPLQVRNLAIEDVSEFPTVWCLDHYFPVGLPDMLIWDFELTSTPESFEAFLRNVAARGDPLLIVRETTPSNNNPQRKQLLQAYVDRNVIVDPLLVHVDQAASPFLNQANVPEAFRQWRTSFGGPPSAPGKEHTHLTVKQHNMIGWLISMHILSALELVAADQIQSGSVLSESVRTPTRVLPPPHVIRRKKQEQWKYDEKEEWVEQSAPAWLSLLIGEAKDPLDSKSSFQFSQNLQCRTTYMTAYTNDTLDSLILSGALDLEAMHNDRIPLMEELILPKGAMFYSKGWVRDLDKATKRQKQLTNQWKFLGFEGMIKKAYYGLPSSGDLKLFLPLSKSTYPQAEKGLDLLPARAFIESVVLCETDLLKYHAADATSDSNQVCRLKKDAYVHVGGEMAFMETIPVGVPSSCVFLNVPEGAKLSFRKEVAHKAPKDGGDSGWEPINKVLATKEEEPSPHMLGLAIEISVRSDKGNFKEPCSLAHVIWSEVDSDAV